MTPSHRLDVLSDALCHYAERSAINLGNQLHAIHLPCMPVLTECAYMRAGDLLVERLKRAEALATTDLELDRLTRTSEGSILSYI